MDLVITAANLEAWEAEKQRLDAQTTTKRHRMGAIEQLEKAAALLSAHSNLVSEAALAAQLAQWKAEKEQLDAESIQMRRRVGDLQRALDAAKLQGALLAGAAGGA